MKRISTLVFFALVLFAVPSFSQTIYTDTMKMTIPFEFSIDGTNYPAGEYTLRLNTAQDQVMIGQNDRFIGIHNTWGIVKDNSTGKSRLVFVMDNGKHVLHQIWIAGQDHGHDLVHPSTEIDIK